MKLPVKNILWAYAFLLVALTYVFGLFIDLTGDSGLYAAIARQMVESGDWFNLTINGVPYEQKPHLLFWLAGLGIRIFGNTNFAFKIFPTLWGAAGFYFIYRFGKIIYSEKAGRLAALIAGTSQIFILYFFDIHTDTVLQTGVILSLWQLAVYLKTDKISAFVFGFLGVGLAMLSKGPVGAIVPFFFVLIFLVSLKKYRELFHPKWLLGIAIVLLVISPTLLHLYRTFGWEGIQFYFVTNNFGRISGEYAGSSSDPTFYLHTLLWAFLPWTVFVVFSIFSEIKSWFSKNEKEVWGISLLGSVLVFTAILSVAKGKAPNYFLLAVPALSIITGKWLLNIETRPAKNVSQLFFLQRIINFLLAVLFFVVVFISPKEKIWPVVFLFIIGIQTIVAAIKFQKLNSVNIFLNTVVLATSLNFFLNAGFIPDLFSYQGARQALTIFEKDKKEGEQLYNFDLVEFELFFESAEPVCEITVWEQLDSIMSKPGNWIYTTQQKLDDINGRGFNPEKVYEIRCFEMNNLKWRFLIPEKREKLLNTNYLIKTK